MGLIQHVWPWNAQPQEAANPAAEALSATTFAAHEWTESESGGRIVGPDGIAFSSDGSTRHAWTQASLPLDPPLWFAIWYDRTVSQSAGTFLGGIGANAATGAALGIRVPSANVAGVNVFFRRVNGGSFIEVGSAGVAATSLNTPVCVVGVIPSASSGDAYVCVGGVRYSTVVTAGTLSGPGAASAFLAVGGLKRDSFSQPSTIRTYGVAFGRAITERFALDLSADPRLMFAPRRIWVPVSAGGSYTLAAESGSYTLAGQAAGLQAARTLAADAGSYTLTGQDVALQRGQRLVADAGSYALTGVDAVLATARVLAADAGAYALNGQAVGLTYTPAGSYSLTAEAGSYSLNGQPVDLTAARSLSAESGSYSLTGQDVGLAKFAGYTLGADAGSYALTGNEAVFDRTWVLLAESGSYALSGSPVTLTWSGEAAPEVVIPAGAGTGPVSQRSRPAANPRERGARQVQMHNQRAIAALMAIVSALD